MGHFGFSYVGLMYLLMLFIPNGIWAKHQPQGYDPTGENKVLLALERIGQVLVTGCALVFSDTNLRPWSPWSLWLVGSFGLMLVYELYWVRYFRKPTLKTFYGAFLKVPLPGATLPVAAFVLLGIYGRLIWLVIATIILGIGHIGIHIHHRKA